MDHWTDSQRQVRIDEITEQISKATKLREEANARKASSSVRHAFKCAVEGLEKERDRLANLQSTDLSAAA